MTATRTRLVLLAVVVLLPIAGSTIADTSVKVKVKCPICGQQHEATLTASSLRLGQRLDLRPEPFPWGIVSPPRVAVCPKCGFVDYRDDDKYAKEELKTLREFVASDEYKQLTKTETTYFRLAKIYERLKKPQSEIAYGYLQATWEVEGEGGKRPKAYLETCLDAYRKTSADDKEPADRRQMARFLQGELLRKLGKFEDAKKHFEELEKLDAFKAPPYPKLIPLELELIGKMDDRPHEIPSAKEKK